MTAPGIFRFFRFHPAPTARLRERGSVLIYIFIAIAVMASLTFAVSRSGREGLTTVDRERSDLHATQILDYTGMIRRALQTMKVDGIADAVLCFDAEGWGNNAYQHGGCSDQKNRVFSIKGGGASFQRPAQALMDTRFQGDPGWGQWHFTGANRIKGVGGDCTDNGECSELLVTLPYIRAEACLALNKRLQVANPETMPEGDLDLITPFTGTFAAGDMLDSPALNGKRSGCFKAATTPSGGPHVFFAVLLAR